MLNLHIVEHKNDYETVFPILKRDPAARAGYIHGDNRRSSPWIAAFPGSICSASSHASLASAGSPCAFRADPRLWCAEASSEQRSMSCRKEEDAEVAAWRIQIRPTGCKVERACARAQVYLRYTP